MIQDCASRSTPYSVDRAEIECVRPARTDRPGKVWRRDFQMQNVIISVGTEVEVEAPYNPHFHDAADEIGGKIEPDSGVWRFARSDEDRIRRLCSEIYSSNTTPDVLYSTSESPHAVEVSVHQRRAKLLDRLDALLDEVAETHSALQTLSKPT